jgi:fructokinase
VSLVERSRPTALISYDPNCRPSLTPDREQTVQAVEAFLGLVDVVKVSRDDLAWLYPRRRWREVVQQWLALGPALAVVTHGEQGASGVTRRGEVSVSTRSVHVVDTVGAGDSFTAAMLSYLHSRGLMTSSFRQQLPDWAGADIREMLEMAALAAAITCSHPGADPPTAEQLGTFRD